MAPKKAETDTKPVYSDEGFTPRNADVLMTYRIEGLDDPQNVADYLWGHWRKRLNEQRDKIGPRIEGSTVVYTFYTIYHGASQEEVKRAEILTGIKRLKEDRVRIKMFHEPAPALPPVIPGIDAPAVLAELSGK